MSKDTKIQNIQKMKRLNTQKILKLQTINKLLDQQIDNLNQTKQILNPIDQSIVDKKKFNDLLESNQF